MGRHPLAALAALSLAALPAGALAQFRAEPMILRLPHPDMDVLPGNFSGAAGSDDLLVLQQGLDLKELRPWHDLRQRAASPFPIGWTTNGRQYRAGYLSQAGEDGLADVATVSGPSVGVVFGSAPGAAQSFPFGITSADSVASFLRLLPRASGASGGAPHEIVVPVCMTDSSCEEVLALDFDAAGLVSESRSWAVTPRLDPTTSGWHEAFPIRLSSTARALGIDDIAIPTFGGVLLLTHASAPAGATLAGLNLAAPVMVGGPFAGGGRPPWLPPSVASRADALGVAAVDVNRDGALDLVFTHSTAFGVEPIPNGSLLWVEGTGNPAGFANSAAPAWRDLGSDPALGLVDPLIVRGLEVGGDPAFAVWDRDLQEVLVVTPDGAAPGGLRVWRAPAPGRRAVDIRLADLVGSPAPDLVVTMADPLGRDSVLVYPDAVDASPALAWAPGSPGSPARGVDHAMAVDASDADGPPPAVEWMIGDPEGTPVALGAAYTHPGASMCGLPPADVAVTVRATDDRGVFAELSATLPVAILSPSIAIAPPGRLVLPPPPRVATVILEGTASLRCAPATWGGTWPAGATFDDDPAPGALRRTVTLAEATYPELLAGTTVVTLSTAEPVPDPVATLAIDIDASGLVKVEREVDRPALAPGEVAVLRTRVQSRLGVALPQVLVVDVLVGLEPVGAPSVSGAHLAETRSGGAVLVVDPLPPAPAGVQIDLPVRSTGGRGASAVEVRSSGGHLLSPSAGTRDGGETLPGCGCGSSGGGALALLALLALARRPRVT